MKRTRRFPSRHRLRVEGLEERVVPTAETEANDTVATANTFALANDTLTGGVGSASDVDFWRATLAQGDVITIRPGTDPGQNHYAPAVEVQNAAGGVVARALLGQALTYVTADAGSHYLRISAPNAYGTYTGSYSVTTSVAAYSGVTETEANETQATANALGALPRNFRGSLASGSDIDFFSFSGTAGQAVAVKFTNLTAANPAVRLYNPSGTEIAIDRTGVGFHATLPLTGTYAISIRGDNTAGAVTGAYVGNVVSAASPVLDPEPGNDFTGAQAWTVTGSATRAVGTLSGLGDVDAFAVDFTAGQFYNFSLQTSAGSLSQQGRTLSLFNEFGQLLEYTAVSNSSVATDAFGFGFRTERTGRHYLVVHAQNQVGLGGYVISGQVVGSFPTRRDVPLYFLDFTDQRPHLGVDAANGIASPTERTPLLVGSFEAAYDTYDVDITTTYPGAGTYVSHGLGNFPGYGGLGGSFSLNSGNSTLGTRRVSGDSFTNDAGSTWARLVDMSWAVSVMRQEAGHATGMYAHARHPLAYIAYDNQSRQNVIGSYFPFPWTDSRVPDVELRNEREYLDRVLQAGRMANDTEPNDTRATANGLDGFLAEMTADADPRNDRVVISGRIGSVTDVDTYQITVAAGKVLAIDIDAAEFQNPLDATLTVRDGTGAALAVSQSAIDRESGLTSVDPYITHQFGTAGTYYIEVTGAAETVGNYRLKVTADQAFDTAGPRVIAAFPDGGTSQDSTRQLTFYFNDHLDPATLTAANVVVSGNVTGVRPGTASFDPLDAVLIWRADAPLPADTYTVTLVGGASGVKDLRGNRLDGEIAAPPLRWPAISGDGAVGGDFVTSFTVTGADTTAASNTSGSYRQHPYNRGVFTLNFNDELDITSLFGTNLVLRGTGPDAAFGTADDTFTPTDLLYDKLANAVATGNRQLLVYTRGIPDPGNYRLEGTFLDAAGNTVNLSRIIAVGASNVVNGPVVADVSVQPNSVVPSPVASVSVTFGGNVETTSLTTSSFRLRRSPDPTFFDANDTLIADADGTIAWDAVNRRATFQPASALSPDYYMLELDGDPGGITDVSNRPLDGEFLDSNIAGNSQPWFWKDAPSGDGVPGGDYYAYFKVATVGEIRGTVVYDLDNDGVRDAGEPGLANRSVYLDLNVNGLLDSGENVWATDASGEFRIPIAGPGTYAVRAVAAGWQSTFPAGGSWSVPVAAGQTVTGKDFGLYRPVAVAGTVFADTNGTRARDAGEPAQAGRTVYIDLNRDGAPSAGEPTATTAADGTYGFTNLAPAAYAVRQVVPAGWSQTSYPPADLPLSTGSDFVVDFGNIAWTGPDAYGYVAKFAPLDAIDLVSGAPGVFTVLDNADDGTIAIDLGSNSFTIYGALYTGNNRLYVSTNGLITFDTANNAWANADLTTSPTQRAIAVLWDDWRTDLDSSDRVLGKFDDLTGDGTPDRLIVEWEQVWNRNGASTQATFQAILELNTGPLACGKILVNLPDADTGNGTTSDGIGATLGIKDIGTQGGNRLLVSHNALHAYVGSGKAILFDPPLNDAPVNTVPGDQTVLEDLVRTFGTATSNAISIADVDAGTGAVRVTLTATNGAMTLSTVAGLTFTTGNGTANPTLTFSGTVAAINTALNGLQFRPTTHFNGSAGIQILTNDLGNTGVGGPLTDTDAVAIAVTAVNDAPSFTRGGNPSVAEDAGPQTQVGWATAISAGPADESGQGLTFLVSNDNPGLFAAQPAIAADGRLTYTPANDANGTATVTVQLQDTGGIANGGVDTSAPQTFTITVSPVNDAPVLDNGGGMALGTVLEDETANAGTLVTDLLASAGGDRVTDVDAGPVEGIAVTATDTADGSWEFSTDNGGAWTALGGVSEAGARVLAADTQTRVRFVPDPDFNGPIGTALTFRAWDRTDGTTNGGTADVTANGGTTAFSSAIETAAITVTAVNDVPGFNMGVDRTVLEDEGAETVPAWATAMSAGPADESGQTLTFLVSNDNPGLFADPPAVNAATGALTFTPADDANGSATVTIRLQDTGGIADGGVDTTTPLTFTITVTAVNDAPAFTKGADPLLDEDAGVQSLPGWATGMTPGPADEAGQGLTFLVDTDNPGLFAVPPTLTTGGTLTFTPAADANGSATVTVRLKDTGATANGGADTSPPQLVTLTVRPVNDVPGFTAGAAQFVVEDPGTQSVPGWATAIFRGPANESGQTLAFVVTTDNPALFATAPAVAPDGTLTYTPADDAYGSATVTVRLTDDGGTDRGGVDTSPPQTFGVSVAPVNDAPVAAADAATVAVRKAVTIPVLANDTDVDLNTIKVTSVTQGARGTVKIQGTKVVYTPRGITGGSDSFTYTVTDGQGGTATATVAMTVTDPLPPTVQAVRVYYGPAAYADLKSLNRAVLPWAQVTRVEVVFSEDVTVAAGHLSVSDAIGAVPMGFTYDPASRTATWDLGRPLDLGRATVRLDRAGLLDRAGNALKADWGRTFGLLAGDFDGNGVVTARDLAAIKRWIGKGNRLADVDGSGLVTQADYDLAKANLGKRVP